MDHTTICNKCGKPFDFWDEQENITVTRRIGYGSTHDGEYLSLHLCSHCMDELLDSCLISPTYEEVVV